jgi:formylglycine-generating enzyme required for sulfatase activity
MPPDFKYPYDPGDGRESREAPKRIPRVLRGGASSSSPRHVRCAVRLGDDPDFRLSSLGFRVVVLPCR